MMSVRLSQCSRIVLTNTCDAVPCQIIRPNFGRRNASEYQVRIGSNFEPGSITQFRTLLLLISLDQPILVRSCKITTLPVCEDGVESPPSPCVAGNKPLRKNRMWIETVKQGDNKKKLRSVSKIYLCPTFMTIAV